MDSKLKLSNFKLKLSSIKIKQLLESKILHLPVIENILQNTHEILKFYYLVQMLNKMQNKKMS